MRVNGGMHERNRWVLIWSEGGSAVITSKCNGLAGPLYYGRVYRAGRPRQIKSQKQFYHLERNRSALKTFQDLRYRKKGRTRSDIAFPPPPNLRLGYRE
ncbi:hypothetical protein SUGI_1225080 [Cryptomeria japonica]|uniref:Uncharacterized protein n=1 Tax=Cryptomeria japonica TaxID=3369 RepID=A0AAD3NRF0_CRYJA|nr:hypothetical protein SUGI_1225080 [Cryptomeria japonica]